MRNGDNSLSNLLRSEHYQTWVTIKAKSLPLKNSGGDLVFHCSKFETLTNLDLIKASQCHSLLFICMAMFFLETLTQELPQPFGLSAKKNLFFRRNPSVGLSMKPIPKEIMPSWWEQLACNEHRRNPFDSSFQQDDWLVKLRSSLVHRQLE